MASVELQFLVLQATDPVSNVEAAIEAFGQVVSNGDPISVAMFVVGAFLTAFSVAVLGYLAAGAVFSSLGRAIARDPPREGRSH